jgi:hypothetical protein
MPVHTDCYKTLVSALPGRDEPSLNAKAYRIPNVTTSRNKLVLPIIVWPIS